MPVNTIAMPARVRGGDHLRVADRAAGLDHRRRAGGDRDLQPVGEREERVGGDDAALRQRLRQPGGLGGFLALPGGDARGVDAARLAGADADRRGVLGIDDGVGLHVLADAEGEEQVVEFRSSVGARRVTDVDVAARPMRPASRVCARKPPARLRNGQAGGSPGRACRRSAAGAGSSCAPGSRVRPSSASGAMITSVKMAAIFGGGAASSVRLTATMPPKAETGSQRKASVPRLGQSWRREATPQGWRA